MIKHEKLKLTSHPQWKSYDQRPFLIHTISLRMVWRDPFPHAARTSIPLPVLLLATPTRHLHSSITNAYKYLELHYIQQKLHY